MKLQFENNEYYLMKDGEELAIATTDESFIKELDAERLSVKNCQAIFNGYDLDELSKEDADLRYNKLGQEDLWLTRVTGIQYGFQKALELLGDKKFSEDDVIYMIERSNNMNFTAKHLISNHKKTEWDVEIETIEYGLGNDENGRPIFETRYLLDGNDCLILKRK